VQVTPNLSFGSNKIHPRVFEEYPFQIHQIQAIRGVFCLHTPQGRKCLKRFKFSKAELIFSYQAIEHLAANGFRGVARFLPTRSRQPYLEAEGELYFLTDWVSGHHCDYRNPQELALAAATLARLHLASRGFTPPEGCPEKIRWGRWPEIFRHRTEELKEFLSMAQKNKPANRLNRLYARYFPYYMRQAQQALALLEKSCYLRLCEEEKKQQSFCHHDFANHNVIITPQREVYVVDFDYAICDLRAHDLSSLLCRAARHQHWTPSLIAFVLEAYEKISPLVPGEIEVMHAFLTFPQDFWQLGVWLYLEKVKPEDSRIQRRIEQISREMANRARFLQQLDRIARQRSKNKT